LYYRLNVIDIQLPPLRERREDLENLCQTLLKRICHESCMPVPALSAVMLEQLKAHPLKGNVRELENLLHRAVALSDGPVLEMDLPYSDSLPAPLEFSPTPSPTTSAGSVSVSQSVSALASGTSPAPSGQTASPIHIPSDLQSHLDAQEREILVRVLTETRFNRTAAAHRLGISLRQIRYRMDRLQIHVPGEDDGKPG